MTPAYLRRLADLADPEKLCRIGVFEQLELPPEKREQLDAGIALRRHAAHIEELNRVFLEQRSLLITPLQTDGMGTAVRTVDKPTDTRLDLALVAQKTDPPVLYALDRAVTLLRSTGDRNSSVLDPYGGLFWYDDADAIETFVARIRAPGN